MCVAGEGDPKISSREESGWSSELIDSVITNYITSPLELSTVLCLQNLAEKMDRFRNTSLDMGGMFSSFRSKYYQGNQGPFFWF